MGLPHRIVVSKFFCISISSSLKQGIIWVKLIGIKEKEKPKHFPGHTRFTFTFYILDHTSLPKFLTQELLSYSNSKEQRKLVDQKITSTLLD